MKAAALIQEVKAAQASATAAAELQRSALEETPARAAALASEFAIMQREKKGDASSAAAMADDAAFCGVLRVFGAVTSIGQQQKPAEHGGLLVMKAAW
jgi:hypothetical protein